MGDLQSDLKRTANPFISKYNDIWEQYAKQAELDAEEKMENEDLEQDLDEEE